MKEFVRVHKHMRLLASVELIVLHWGFVHAWWGPDEGAALTSHSVRPACPAKLKRRRELVEGSFKSKNMFSESSIFSLF